tara:strand:+ start:29684 stop:30481 length:798 start_codon:yes stop_codon:yes gene_type:complete
MKKIYAFIVYSFYCVVTSAQVGIGTTSPSRASMLEVSGTTNGTAPYKGFMPARVPTQVNRDAIRPSFSDNGLLIFVEETGTLEIWNGIFWEVIYTFSTFVTTIAAQDFDSNLTWSYTLSPGQYNVTNDIWMIGTDLGTGNTTAIDIVNDNFLACRDLDNIVGGGNFFHEIAFVNVDLTGFTNCRMTFDYDAFEFDNGDDIEYEVFYDDISQGVVNLVNGVGNLSQEGTVIINIPNVVTNVRITVGISQNGDADFAGFDNFRVYGE